ncbi:hypothetical protein FHS11_001316 [Mucilaginibacter gotjawali]|uniref:Uncharacterized protein n=1 Tax=Mucilaginibacter gotjawali TaxID=1550579 RepID=A0A839SE29_9SPHI|nr:hypothetical protein [Mucilaginibacter gotjawali]
MINYLTKLASLTDFIKMAPLSNPRFMSFLCLVAAVIPLKNKPIP